MRRSATASRSSMLSSDTTLVTLESASLVLSCLTNTLSRADLIAGGTRTSVEPHQPGTVRATDRAGRFNEMVNFDAAIAVRRRSRPTAQRRLSPR